MTSSDALPVRLRPEIASMAAYKQGRPAPADGFKLSSNENAYPPLPSVLDVVAAAAGRMNRYPDGATVALKTRLAERHGVDLDQIHLGAGGISILTQLVVAAAGPGDEVVYSWRSFEAYPGLATVAGARSVQVPNRSDHSHDLSAMAESITERTRVILVCSPNNPTGTIVTAGDFAAFMERVPRDLLVILDEAYGEFRTDPDAVDGGPLIGRYPNLVLLRTFSKAYGLAGLRIGYAVGPAAVLAAAHSAAVPMSVTDVAQEAALASIDVDDELMERVARIVLQRDRMREALIDAGWRIPEAQGNFLWLPTGEATDVVAARFFDAGLVVRPFHPDGIRVGVGEPESVEPVLRVARESLALLPPAG